MQVRRLPAVDIEGWSAAWDSVFATIPTVAPFLGSRFLVSLLREFGTGHEQAVVADQDGATQCVALLTQRRPGQWQTFQPSQLPLGAIVARPQLHWEQLMPALMGALPAFTISLGVTQQDPLIRPRPECGHSSRLSCLDYFDTAWIDIAGTFDAYWAERGKNLRHNLRKQRKGLVEQKVAVQLECLTAAEGVAAAIADYGALESAGWKSSTGTAIHPQNAQGRFYRAMLEDFCATGHGRIYRFSLDHRVVAIDLCIESTDTLVILKTTYDESQRQLSPALLMREESFRQLFDDGRFKRIEFYGKRMDWHARWTEKSRQLYHINCDRWKWISALRTAMRSIRRSSKTESPPPVDAAST